MNITNKAPRDLKMEYIVKISEIPEIKSRLKYVTDPKAQNMWNFLATYLKWDGYKTTIPASIVLDALSMINQDKIVYSEG